MGVNPESNSQPWTCVLVYTYGLKLLTGKVEEAHFGFCCRIIPSNSEKANLLIQVGFL